MQLPRFALPRAPRRIAAPWWAIVITIVWLTGVGVVTWLSRFTESAPPLCLFHRITGVPCPTCGTTRMVLALGDGRPLDAFLLNPFMFIALMVGAAWLLLRLGIGRTLSLDVGRAGRRAAWMVVGALFLLNWAYLIWVEFG